MFIEYGNVRRILVVSGYVVANLLILLLLLVRGVCESLAILNFSLADFFLILYSIVTILIAGENCKLSAFHATNFFIFLVCLKSIEDYVFHVRGKGILELVLFLTSGSESSLEFVVALVFIYIVVYVLFFHFYLLLKFFMFITKFMLKIK